MQRQQVPLLEALDTDAVESEECDSVAGLEWEECDSVDVIEGQAGQECDSVDVSEGPAELIEGLGWDIFQMCPIFKDRFKL